MIRRALYAIGHDWLAHSMITLSGGAAWAWKVHDFFGDRIDPLLGDLILRGRGLDVALAVQTLANEGWAIRSTRWVSGVREIIMRKV